MAVISDPLQFDWNAGNSGKNKRSHNVEDWECEEVFFDPQKIMLKDKLHSGQEERFILLGKTRQERLLYLVFTIRNGKIRIISARDVTKKKEIELYEKAS
ncbi:MAG TPA: BrnT family toxin [Candidatus Saccharimonadales bacterium]|nr:BrnT family toxin [Candidatus Saccharimonadales bacterium]